MNYLNNKEYAKELYHHGILGMKWGKKNGPPYPLDAKDHSASEKKAGWRKSLSKDDGNNIEKKHSKKINYKKVLAIGATTVAASLLIYGGVKYYNNTQHGKRIVDKILSANDTPEGFSSFPNVLKPDKKYLEGTEDEILDKIQDSTKGSNPSSNHRNCVSTSFTGALRLLGIPDAKALPDRPDDNPYRMSEIVKCFKGAKIETPFYDGSALNKKDAYNKIISKLSSFGDGATGVLTRVVRLKGLNKSHALTWTVVNGKVKFFDYQSPLYAKESKIARSNMYDDPWTQIFGYKGLVFEDLTYVRLDGCEVDYDKLEDFIKIQ